MDYSIARRRMVEQVKGQGVSDPLVLEAMLQVPRHLFVEEALQNQAYGDFPLPIGEKQTISHPYMVAVMTESLRLRGGENVLEVGTGSGYQAAVLARIAARVYSIERLPSLARRARRLLDQAGYGNVNIKLADGTVGWQEASPFDGILVAAGAPSVPQGYLNQLAPGGRLIIPIGDRQGQTLVRFTRVGAKDFLEESLLACRFVPLVGKFGWKEDE